MDRILNRIKGDRTSPERLDLESRFKFRCHKGISCFNTCCGDLDLFLTPYDILRLKKRFAISSGEFLEHYTETTFHEETKLPFIKLRMDHSGKCLFVTDEGCTIYSDRLLVCRYYPLGFGILKNHGEKWSDFYFMVKEGYCKGFEEDREWTMRQWRDDQEIHIYDDMNKDWVDLILNKQIYGKEIEPDEKSLRMFFMGSYDIDSFRNFAFQSKLLQLLEMDEELIDLIRTDESELMKFAHRWLQYVLFKKPTISLKEIQ